MVCVLVVSAASVAALQPRGPVAARFHHVHVNSTDPAIADCPDGVRSFFVAGPDAVLIEIVEAKPIPDGLWR